MNNLLTTLKISSALYASTDEILAPKPKKPLMSWPLPWAITEPVVEAMQAVPEVISLKRLWQFPLGSSHGQNLSILLLASALVKRTFALGEAEKAVQELLSLVETNNSYARIVMVLAGVETEEAVELSSGVTLTSFSNVEPPSWMKDFAEERLWPLSRSFEPVAPSTALVMRVPFSPVFSSAEQVEGKFPEQEINFLRTVAHCIVLAAARPSAVLKVWFEDDDPRLPLFTGGVIYSDPRWGSGVAASYVVDGGQIRSVISDYQDFQGGKGALDTALDRLTAAWGGWHREERAIDLGIALEAVLMFTSDGQSDDNNEISYKLGVRAAWLLGDNFEQRLVLFRQVRRLYRFRSQAAHSGQIKTKLDTWRVLDEEIETGIKLAGQIIIAILKRGTWPNWDELVLTGKDPETSLSQ